MVLLNSQGLNSEAKVIGESTLEEHSTHTKWEQSLLEVTLRITSDCHFRVYTPI